MTSEIPEWAAKALERASKETGLSDFGPESFREPFHSFVRHIEIAGYTATGLAEQDHTIHRWLVNRLRFAEDLRRHPEILDEDVSDPIVILGFPRSGTTVLQRMMSADSSKQSLKLWRVLNPAPFPGENPCDPAGRLAFAKAAEDGMRANKPASQAAHPLIANDADEDYFMHLMSFRHIGQLWYGLINFPYLEYIQSLERQPTYDYVADLLRYLQWQDGGRRGRRWIMKSPAHIGNVEQILAVHPRATFVYPRRDFKTVMASFCHTAESNLQGSIDLPPAQIGAVSLAAWSHEMQRFRQARDQFGDALRLYSVDYREMLADPVASIRSILKFAGSSLEPGGEAEIRRWIANNPAGKHGTNTYSLERYGLTEEDVEQAFSQFE